MGDPRKTRKKYQTPMHPWSASRIEDEKVITVKFGTKNKKEIWRMASALKRFKDQAKHLSSLTGRQADLERQQMMDKMVGLGLISPGASLDDILSLTLDDLMTRRLQTVMVKRLLARTPKQARQLISHGHVMVGEKIITSPGHLLTVADESRITFRPRSPFLNDQHPERFSEAELRAKDERAKAKAAKKAADEEEVAPPAYSEEDILDPEELGKKKKAEKKVEELKAEVKDEKTETPVEKPTEKKKADENVEQKKTSSDSDKQDELKKEIPNNVEKKVDQKTKEASK